MSVRSFVAVLMVFAMLPSVAAGQAGPSDGSIFRWSGGQWVQVDGFGVRISVGPDGSPWVVNSRNEIFRSSGGRNFQKLPGTATDIAVGGDGSAWIIGTDSNIYRWNGNAWDRIRGPASRSASIEPDAPWVVNAANEIYQWNGDRFVKQPGTARDVAAGSDVWIVGTDRQIYRFGTNDWSPMGGSGDRISAGGAGIAWVVNAGGEIYRFQSGSSQRVSGSAMDIAANANGDVWMVGNARGGDLRQRRRGRGRGGFEN